MNSEIRIVKAISKLTENDKQLDIKIDNCTQEIKEAENSLKKEINDSVSELDKKIEQYKHDKPKDGINGKDGRDGQDGYTPIKGIDYFDGKDGIDGKNGINGINGKDGERGERGLSGKDGINGKDGADGIGIKSVSINDSGELVIVLTDNKKYNLGRVVGINGGKGLDGISVTNASIVDNHLIITLSNGETIDAGVIGGGSGGTSDHSQLTNLDYENSGHTGFASEEDVIFNDGDNEYRGLQEFGEMLGGSLGELAFENSISYNSSYITDKPTLGTLSSKNKVDYNTDIDNLPTIPSTDNFVQKTDYATVNSAGIVALPYDKGFMAGDNGYIQPRSLITASNYNLAGDDFIVTKATLNFKLGDKIDKGTEVTSSITSSNWIADNTISPFKYRSVITIPGVNEAEELELINNNAVNFATYGFCIGAILTNNIVHIYSLEKPASAVNLEMRFR